MVSLSLTAKVDETIVLTTVFSEFTTISTVFVSVIGAFVAAVSTKEYITNITIKQSATDGNTCGITYVGATTNKTYNTLDGLDPDVTFTEYVLKLLTVDVDEFIQFRVKTNNAAVSVTVKVDSLFFLGAPFSNIIDYMIKANVTSVKLYGTINEGMFSALPFTSGIVFKTININSLVDGFIFNGNSGCFFIFSHLKIPFKIGILVK